MKEIWKDIDGYPGYKVSNLGKVGGPRKDELKLCKNGDEYFKVTLCNKYGHKDHRVNRLVASAFLDNPNNHPLVMHKDNNPENNEVSNLQWGTHGENNQYMYDCGRHGINLTDEVREKAYEVRRVGIIAINIHTGEETYYISQHDAARNLNVSQQHIWGVLNGHRRSTGGYYFKYADEERECNRHPLRRPIRIKPIRAIHLPSGNVYIFETIKRASIEIDMSYYVISKILNGKLDQRDGWTFEYMDEEELINGYY